MIIYPAIDLRGGRVVRLTAGRFDQETSYGDDPVAVARGFAAAGARWLHVVDLDGAKDPAQRQTALVARLARESGLAMQTGGGIRRAEQMQALLDAGAARVIIGSLAVSDPTLVAGWFERFGSERLVLALDARADTQGVFRLATAGWQQTSALTVAELVARYLPHGLRHVLCTDIGRDGKLTGPNTVLHVGLRTRFPAVQWQASGVVASLADLRGLKSAHLAGAIVGRALYENKFTLAEALTC